MALTPAEKQAAYRARQNAEREKLQASAARVQRLEAYVNELQREIRALKERKQVVANSSASKRMTAPEFKFVRGLLHPDRHPDELEKYNRAFEIFNRIPEPKTQKRR